MPSQSLPSDGEVFAGDVDDVLQVIDHPVGAAVEQRFAEEARLIHDADHAAGRRHGADLLVVEVAPVGMHAADAGVADQERLRAIVDLDGVEEAAPVDVRQVDEDACAR